MLDYASMKNRLVTLMHPTEESRRKATLLVLTAALIGLVLLCERTVPPSSELSPEPTAETQLIAKTEPVGPEPPSVGDSAASSSEAIEVRTPKVDMPTGVQVLSPGRQLPIQLDYVHFARIRSLAIEADEIDDAMRWTGRFQHDDDPIVQLPAAWQKRVQHKTLSVTEPGRGVAREFDPFEKRRADLVLVVLDAPGLESKVVLVQRGTLNVMMKVAEGKGLAWVTDHEGEPVHGAKVTILQGKTRHHTAFTNTEGIAELPASARMSLKYSPNLDIGDDYYRPLLAIARKGGHTAFTSQTWTTGVEPWEFDIPMHYYYGAGSLVGSVATERGIYRPGQPVHVVGAVRKRQKNGSLEVPRAKARVRLLDPDYTTVSAIDTPLTEFGTFRFTSELPRTARLGRYSIEVTVGDTTLYHDFRVAKYRPNRFEVKVQEVEPIVLGQTTQIQIATRANYLYGAKLATGSVAYHVSVRAARDGDEDGFRANDEADASSFELLDEEAELRDGVHQLSIPLSSLDALSFPRAQRLELLVQADVTDEAGDTITGHQVILVHKNESTVWLRNRHWLVDSKAGWDVELRASSVGTMPQAGIPAVVELYKREWTTTAMDGSRGVRYSSHPREEKVASKSVMLTETEKSVHFAIPNGGTYFIRARSAQATAYAEAEVWAYGDSSYGRFDNQPRLAVHSNKKSYDPGDTARLLVESPYASATALVTLEHDGVVYAKTQRLVGAGSEIAVKLSEAHLPNVYASVAVIPRTNGKFNVTGSPLRVGYLHLSVSPERRRLDVSITPRKLDARPGETVPVDVRLKDASGKPVRGEVTLWASDEGVLKLTGYRTPDVFAPIYRAHDLRVSTSSSLLRFLTLGYDDDGMGGDSGPGADVNAAFRSRFLETAFFSRGVRTNARGEATVELPLPDNLTRWRIMATAADTTNRFGSGEASLTTSKPLQVSPVLPRFLTRGDTLEGGVVIHNNSSRAGVAAVTVSVAGGTLKGPGTRQVEVTGSSQNSVAFPLVADSIGRLEVKASVSFQGETDGFRMSLPVHAATEQHVEKVLDEVISAPKTFQVALPNDADPESARLIVEAAPGELASLGAALDSLIDYPHGCTEQTTSRLIPMAQLGKMLSGHPVFESHAHLQKMQSAIVHLLGHQNEDGGFGLWPESDSEGFLTAYALWGLQLAEESGLEVPQVAMEGAFAYLTRNDGNVEGYGYIGEQTRRPFAAFVFARKERTLPSDLRSLLDEADSLSLLGQGLLFASAPKAERSVDLLTRMLQRDASDASNARGEHDGWVAGNSALHDDAGLLLALSESGDLVRASRYASKLLGARIGDGSWGSTQDNLWALTALNAYLGKTLRTERSEVTLTLSDGMQLERKVGNGYSRTLSSTKDQPYTRTTMELSSAVSRATLTPGTGQSKGRVIVRLAYHKKPDMLTSEDAGFQVRRRLLAYETDTPLRDLEVGQLVRIELEVDSAKAQHQVALVDRLPAGLEVVDLSLNTTPKTSSSHEDVDYTWISHEAHDERVAFFSNHLSSGKHHASYVARATRKGQFAWPAPRAEAMYQVDVYGIGALQGLKVE